MVSCSNDAKLLFTISSIVRHEWWGQKQLLSVAIKECSKSSNNVTSFYGCLDGNSPCPADHVAQEHREIVVAQEHREIVVA